MMNLLGAGNPYVKRYAEGGDVQSGSISNPGGQFARDFPDEYRKNQERAYESALTSLISNAARDFDNADEYVASVAASSGDVGDARRRADANAEQNFYQILNAQQKALGRYGLAVPEQLRTVQGFREVFGPGFSYEVKEVGQKYFDESERLRQDWLARTQGLSNWARSSGPPKPEGVETVWDRMTQRLGTYQPKPPPPTLVPSVPESSAPAPSPIPVSPVPVPVLPTPDPVMGGNLTPQPLPGITPPAPLPATGIPQPGMPVSRPVLNTGVLPQYQSPTAQAAPTTQQQQPQQQIQYGPIGQGAVGQTNLLSTLLSQQQDPTKVSLLGFDNPYLMKPFG
jgi:hypothetical protein